MILCKDYTIPKSIPGVNIVANLANSGGKNRSDASMDTKDLQDDDSEPNKQEKARALLHPILGKIEVSLHDLLTASQASKDGSWHNFLSIRSDGSPIAGRFKCHVEFKSVPLDESILYAE